MLMFLLVLVVGLVPVDLVAVVACFCSVGIKTNELQREASVKVLYTIAGYPVSEEHPAMQWKVREFCVELPLLSLLALEVDTPISRLRQESNQSIGNSIERAAN